MHVSLDQLTTHLELSDQSPESLRDLLTFAGIEVENLKTTGFHSEFVVIAQIESFVPHPNADRLRVCQVNDGSGTLRQIVCGAKNFKEGDKVPLALPGAVLPGNFEIKVGNLRGVESAGMLCAGREIGIEDDADGLLILDPALPVGCPLHEHFKPDVIVEVEVTPNRPDLLSHYGLARELSALLKRPLKTQLPLEPQTQVATGQEVQLLQEDLAPYYVLRQFSGAKVSESPAWLQDRLRAIGLRPINNVVDITNYVLFELGQPLHAFDAAKLQGGLSVRRAKDLELFKALDEKTYTLTEQDLVIADQTGPVALAGVMGGLESGVTESTTEIWLEAAWFQPSSVRRTARRLNLHSDSSYRFERGVDAHATLIASELAAKLIIELTGAREISLPSVAGTPPVRVGNVAYDHARARDLLSLPLPDSQIQEILSGLGLKLVGSKENHSTWNIPSYRADLQREVDLSEELARVLGLDDVPSRALVHAVPPSEADLLHDSRMKWRNHLASLGFREIDTLKLISKSALERALIQTGKNHAHLRNPLSEDYTTLRPSLAPGLLEVASRNQRQGQESLRFFEIGRVFGQVKEGITIEPENLGILLAGPLTPSNWAIPEYKQTDWAEFIGILSSLLPSHAGTALVNPWKSSELAKRPAWITGGDLAVGGRSVGSVGWLHPAQARALDLPQPVLVAELDLKALRRLNLGHLPVVEPPKFPSITRDVAMEVPISLPQRDVHLSLAKIKEPLLVHFQLFDVFADPTGEKISADSKSLAYRFTYLDQTRTLESSEVDKVHQRVRETIIKMLPVKIR